MVEIPKRSKAAVLTEYRKPYKIMEYPIPEVEPRGILVRVEMAGICGTDVHHWEGTLGFKAPLPNIQGHETVGRIAKLGEGRTHDCMGQPLKVGDRILWAHVHCGECYFCAIASQPTLCTNVIYYAVRCSDVYPHLMGGFAEYEYVIPKADVVRVPEELKNEEVVGVGCAFRSAMSAYERLGGYGMQDNVVIQGCGPVGLYSLVLAIEGGAGKTIVVGAPGQRLELAKKWGADYVINIDEAADPAKRLEQVLQLTDGRGPDVVVEASGVPAAFGEGIEMIRRGGRYLVIGQVSKGKTIPLDPALFTVKHLEVIGSLAATIKHYAKALRVVQNRRNIYPFADIVTGKYRLDQINEALAAMKSGKEIKPVVIP